MFLATGLNRHKDVECQRLQQKIADQVTPKGVALLAIGEIGTTEGHDDESPACSAVLDAEIAVEVGLICWPESDEMRLALLVSMTGVEQDGESRLNPQRMMQVAAMLVAVRIGGVVRQIPP